MCSCSVVQVDCDFSEDKCLVLAVRGVGDGREGVFVRNFQFESRAEQQQAGIAGRRIAFITLLAGWLAGWLPGKHNTRGGREGG